MRKNFLRWPKLHQTSCLEEGQYPLNNRPKNCNVIQSCTCNPLQQERFFPLNLIYTYTPLYPAWNAPIIRFTGAGDALPNNALLISPLSTAAHTHTPTHTRIMRHKNITGLCIIFTHCKDGDRAYIGYVILNIKKLRSFYENWIQFTLAKEPSRNNIQLEVVRTYITLE